MAVVQNLRITRAQLNARAAANQVLPGQVYLISDENRLAVGTSASTYVAQEKQADATITFVIDGGGAAITTGVKGDITVPFDCTVLEWTLLADQTGSAVVEVSKASYSGWPTVSAITASAKPTLSSARKAQSSALTGWNTAISAGDVLQIGVNSAATVQRVTLALRVRRT